MSQLSIALFVAWMAREVWFFYVTHKLINKLMSKNYYDFKLSENIGKESKVEVLPPETVYDGGFEEMNRIGIL